MSTTQSRKPVLYIGVSTKTYLGYAQTIEWLRAAREGIQSRPELKRAGVVPFFLPSFPLLQAALAALGTTSAMVGAQNTGWITGPDTGEVSAGLLAEMGVTMVEVGHAERRKNHGETDDLVRQKVVAILEAGMVPLLCVGESDLNSPAATAAHCFDQISSAVSDNSEILKRMIIAYEPVWAIGAAAPAPADYVNAVVADLRYRLESWYGESDRIPIIYGGSAGPGVLSQLSDVDGLFLGRFGHDISNFLSVLDEAIDRAPKGRSGRSKPGSTSRPLRES